jgi:energy-coupling factor transport system permease protein
MGLWGFGAGLRWLAIPLAVIVIGIMAAVFRSMGRRVQRSRYRRERWRQRDTLLTAISASALTVFLVASRFDWAVAYFYPYPRVTWPGFNPVVGAVLLAFVSPVLLLGRKQERGPASPPKVVATDDSL